MKAVTAPSHYIGVGCVSPGLGQRAVMSPEETREVSSTYDEPVQRIAVCLMLSGALLVSCVGGSSGSGTPLPGVIPCTPPPDFDYANSDFTPVRSGVLQGQPPFPTPDDALTDFLQSEAASTFARDGYETIQIPGPDDLLLFGKDFGSGYTNLIAVQRLPGGWVARWWASSGC
jgi:hypothetical protein